MKAKIYAARGNFKTGNIREYLKRGIQNICESLNIITLFCYYLIQMIPIQADLSYACFELAVTKCKNFQSKCQ